MKTIIAIDPGASGGIAVSMNGVNAFAMPKTPGEIISLIRRTKSQAFLDLNDCEAYVEEVGGYIGGGGQPGSAMFKFGAGYGFILGVLQTLQIPITLVRPQKWQKYFSLGTSKDCANKADWKRKLQAEAQRRFPHLNVTLKTADALLILAYARSLSHEIESSDNSQKELVKAEATLTPQPIGRAAWDKLL